MEERPPARPVTAEDRLQRRRRLSGLVARRDALEEEACALDKEHGGMLRRSKDPRPPPTSDRHPPLALTPLPALGFAGALTVSCAGQYWRSSSSSRTPQR